MENPFYNINQRPSFTEPPIFIYEEDQHPIDEILTEEEKEEIFEMIRKMYLDDGIIIKYKD